MLKTGRSDCSGLTLIEMMVGLAIMGLLMFMLMPSYQIWIGNTQIRTMSESVQSGLLKARQEAIQRNAPMQFVLAGSAWSIGCETATAECPATIEGKGAKEGTNESINLTAITIVFDQFGRRKLPAPADGMISIPVDSSSLSASDSRDLRITISPEGGIRMCDPNVYTTGDPRKC